MTATATEPRVETRRIGALERRASFSPASINRDARTVEVVWTTGATVRRHRFFGDPYDEILSVDPQHVRLGRMNEGGAPFLESHSSYSVRSVLGKIEPGSVRIENGKGYATVRFSKRDEVEEIFRDVEDGILGNVSVGYRVHRFDDETEKGDEVRQLRAVDWEPYEVSLVPIGADAGASIRSDGAPGDDAYECQIVTRNHDEQRAMPEEITTPTETPTEVRTETAPQATAAPAVDTDAIREEAARAERARAAEIRRSAAALSLDASVAERLVEEGRSVEEAHRELIDAAAARSEQTDISNTGAVQMGTEEFEKRNAAAEEALEFRMDPSRQMTEGARLFAGRSLLEIAERNFEARIGRRIPDGLRKEERAALQMNHPKGINPYMARGGAHSTSDFPILLENIANKRLRAGYDLLERTWTPMASFATAPDFREMTIDQMGEGAKMLPVAEGGEYTFGTFGESKEVYSVSKYGRGFLWTFEMMVNDDLNAFARATRNYLAQVVQNESDLAWAQLTDNANMGDGTALFHADHGNIGTGAISIASLGAAREAMTMQTGLDGESFITVRPSYLFVPPALETVAEQVVVLRTQPQEDSKGNPFKGSLSVVSEPRLQASSALQWYLAASPGSAGVDVLEVAYLEGHRAPEVRQEQEFHKDAMGFIVRHIVGMKILDWRGLYRSSGA